MSWFTRLFRATDSPLQRTFTLQMHARPSEPPEPPQDQPVAIPFHVRNHLKGHPVNCPMCNLEPSFVSFRSHQDHTPIVTISGHAGVAVAAPVINIECYCEACLLRIGYMLTSQGEPIVTETHGPASR